MQSKITLIGMYNFDNTLFDELTFPAGINRDLAINRILEKSEEFELVYADFDYLKDRIGIWGKLWERTFSKWYEALNIDYEPLYNYDRYEEYEDTKANDFNNSSSSNSVDSVNAKSNSTTSTGSESSSNTTNKVSAYDDADFSNKEYETAGAETKQNGVDSSSSSQSALNNASTTSSGKSGETIKHTAHLYGNIGVTTSAQMLKEQLDVVEWNLYEHISDIFIDEFCILVY